MWYQKKIPPPPNPPPVLIQQASSSAIIKCTTASDNNYMHTQLRINTYRNYDLLSVLIGLASASPSATDQVPPGIYYHTKALTKSSNRNPACTQTLPSIRSLRNIGLPKEIILETPKP